jgi:transposase
MGRPAGWMKALTGRSPMMSPGAPALRREVERLFWRQIAEGLSSEDAATAVGVSQAAGTRWFRERGGMPLFLVAPLTGRYLSFAEREEIAVLKGQGLGVRAIARRVGRDPSTISRELRRNAATRGGKLDYRASVAQWKADLLARRPKAAKLVTNDRLRECVQQRLSGQIRRPMGRRCRGRWRHHGTDATSPGGRTGDGSAGGARSRSRTGSGSTSRMMTACASRTRRSTSPSTCRAAASCAGIWPAVCAPVVRCANHAGALMAVGNGSRTKS